MDLFWAWHPEVASRAGMAGSSVDGSTCGGNPDCFGMKGGACRHLPVGPQWFDPRCPEVSALFWLPGPQWSGPRFACFALGSGLLSVDPFWLSMSPVLARGGFKGVPSFKPPSHKIRGGNLWGWQAGGVSRPSDAVARGCLPPGPRQGCGGPWLRPGPGPIPAVQAPGSRPRGARGR